MSSFFCASEHLHMLFLLSGVLSLFHYLDNSYASFNTQLKSHVPIEVSLAF